MKKDGSSTVDATEDSANRRSIARWLPCKPPSTPGIGMFDTFTMRATPAASAASTALVSNCTWSRVGEDTRNRARTPAIALVSDAGSPRSPSTTSLTPTLSIASGRRTSARTATPSCVSARTTRPPRSPAAPTTSTVMRSSLARHARRCPARDCAALCVARHRPDTVAMRRCLRGPWRRRSDR